ncbi:hypothetical protein DRW07_00885 [Alteromonas sediminis]|uniref:Uncharacterized protein n=1 Tax=Alteromonas sediminis TaxID=2259342 RepID=A0A3N5Y2M1_9ALTE|nr:hypothetical protein [Alteromonas sediminis]RPJ68002.1 hypothetical protein DRW07_00885 [Alteromonas sediminis]
MSAIMEALPEILIILVVFGVIFMLAKKKLSKERQTEMLVVFTAGGAIGILLLLQSGTPATSNLEVSETFAATNAALAEKKDASPETLTAEESSARLETLIEEQKQNTSLSDKNEKSDDEK